MYTFFHSVRGKLVLNIVVTDNCIKIFIISRDYLYSEIVLIYLVTSLRLLFNVNLIYLQKYCSIWSKK